jgi:hypothetical protein
VETDPYQDLDRQRAAKDAELVTLRAKCTELEAKCSEIGSQLAAAQSDADNLRVQVDDLKAQLGTERDRFGKRETELMAQLREKTAECERLRLNTCQVDQCNSRCPVETADCSDDCGLAEDLRSQLRAREGELQELATWACEHTCNNGNRIPTLCRAIIARGESGAACAVCKGARYIQDGGRRVRCPECNNALTQALTAGEALIPGTTWVEADNRFRNAVLEEAAKIVDSIPALIRAAKRTAK